MSDPQADLGGRLPLIAMGALAPEQRQALDALKRTFLPSAAEAGFIAENEDGRPIGPFNSAFYSPEISTAFLDYQATEQRHSSLERRVREVVILTVGAVWQSAYELYAHAILARGTGLSDAAIDQLRSGDEPDALSEAEAIAHRVARQLTLERQIDPELFDAARSAFGFRGLVDLVHLVGAYQTVCGLLNGFQIPAPKV